MSRYLRDNGDTIICPSSSNFKFSNFQINQFHVNFTSSTPVEARLLEPVVAALVIIRIQTFCDWLFTAAGKVTLTALLLNVDPPVVNVPVGVAFVKLVGLSP